MGHDRSRQCRLPMTMKLISSKEKFSGHSLGVLGVIIGLEHRGELDNNMKFET